MKLLNRRPGRRKAKTTTTAEDVLRLELQKAHQLHPVRLLPSSIIAALDEAGFVILSHDDLNNEIALAYQAGVDETDGA